MLTLLWLALAASAPAASQVRFDVFVGYDGFVPQAGWFPVVCEVENTGPAFNAIFEFSPTQYGDRNQRLMPVELPTGTTKRFAIPVPSSGGYGYSWSARLLDEKGRVRAEWTGRQARRMVSWQIPLTAALTRTSAGLPVFPEIASKVDDLKPAVARLLPPVFPDNPITLEGLRTIYLSSERALELNARQAAALQAWLFGGGHLIVGVDQIGQVTGNEWLDRLMPVALTGSAAARAPDGLQAWVTGARRFDGATQRFTETAAAMPPQAQRPNRPGQNVTSNPGRNPWVNLTPDPAFESARLHVSHATLRDGQVIAGTEAEPLAVSAPRGRGQLTALLFSPELEPFLSWSHRSVFWARLADLPPELFINENYTRSGWRGLDSVFGAMLDSAQIRKLPVGVLMLLLLGYLAVIGPIDRWWLKKINRPILTWITFPIYVALFSGLIYLIGYKLRAGETEWNELLVVDVTPHGERADWRGRTWGSVYSPANASYRFAGTERFATIRPEYLGGYGGQNTGRMKVIEKENGFESEASVPVWTSQLFAADWWRQAATPLRVTLRAGTKEQADRWTIEVENRLDRPVADAKLVWHDRVYNVGRLAAGQTTNLFLDGGFESVSSFVSRYAQTFDQAANQRQQTFGNNERQVIRDLPQVAMATSFLGASRGGQSQNFIRSPGYDLTPLLERGDAVLLAWVPDYSPVKPLNQFSPRRSRRDTLFRVTAPAPASAPTKPVSTTRHTNSIDAARILAEHLP